MKFSIKDIQSEVFSLGKKINAPRSLLVVNDKPSDDGTPYVKIDGAKFIYAFSERGCDFNAKETSSIDEFLYSIEYCLGWRWNMS